MQIEAIARQTTADLVVERITQVIRERNLSAGERLPGEHELVEQLRVSRPVLRSPRATAKHGADGRPAQPRNVRRQRHQPGELRATVAVRGHDLASGVAVVCRTSFGDRSTSGAASRGTGDRRRHCGTCRLRETTRRRSAVSEALELDFQFHRKVLEAAGNPLMQNLMEVIYEFVLTQIARTTPSPRNNQLGRRLHKAILTAVRNHDPDAAAKAMQQHMQAVLKRLTP